jgi:hypothetical protein
MMLRKGDPIPPLGLCECGCKQMTKPAKYTSATFGWLRGRPTRFVPGHQTRMKRRKGADWIEEDCGYETPCWVWQHGFTGSGYGNVAVKEHPSRYAHRMNYERLVGPIPDGLHIDHLCRNRACCNPAHLEPVTPGENARRAGVPRDPITGRFVAQGASIA